MSLAKLVNDVHTDKNTTHSYLELYQTLLQDKKETATDILEIGIGDFKEKNGGSILLWKQFFTNATVHALDILPVHRVLDELINDNRVVLYTSVNAYDENFFKMFLDKNIKMDFLLDDGPHTLESMKQFIKLYSQIMKEDGILIIEDVPSMDWIDILKSVTPDYLKSFIEVYDLRENKGRYDDIVFVINKSLDLKKNNIN